MSRSVLDAGTVVAWLALSFLLLEALDRRQARRAARLDADLYLRFDHRALALLRAEPDDGEPVDFAHYDALWERVRMTAPAIPDPVTGELLTQADVEKRMIALVHALEDGVGELDGLVLSAAAAEADYRLTRDTALVRIAAESRATGDKITVGERDAVAETLAADEFRRWKLVDARVRSKREYLHSLRAALDTLRTVSANIRAQT